MNWVEAMPFINVVLLGLWCILLWLDTILFKRRLKRIPNGRTEEESTAIVEWFETSREMKIRRKTFGNVYWDGYNWLMGKKA